MQKSLFFNDLGEGYLYQAEDFADYFNSFIGNGIYAKNSTNLQVVANSGFDITVKAGKAWINGYLYVNTADITIHLDQSDGSLDRIDAIAVRWGENKLQVIKIEGEYNKPAEAPQPKRDENTYDLILAYVKVSAGLIQITDAEIEDTRLNTELCGLMHGLIEQVDTTTLYNQIKSDLDGFKEVEQKEFEEWFENIKGLLDGDVGTTLALKVDELEKQTNKHYKQRVASVEGVHGFRYNTTNETLEVESSDGQWTEVSGGMAGALLSPVTDIKVKASNAKLTVSWTDSTEETWAGTKLVYKVGSYPENPKDGTLAVDNKVKDQYKTTGFDINALNNGTKYYFAFFPYDTKNKYSLNVDNRAIGTPQAFRTMTVIRDKNNSNSETCLTYGDNATSMAPKSEEWDEFFGHFPCLFKNGEIVGRLNKQDRTKFEDGRPADITSGNEGDVMIAFPKRKLKIVTSGSNIHVSMTDNLDADSSFEDNAHIRGINPKDYFFVGAYAGSLIGGKLRSLNGKTPAVNMTIGQARNYARANGAGYDQLAFYQLTYLQAMYLLKYKNLNSQQAVGRGYVDGNSAVLNTGGTETKGMDWGENTGKQHMVLFGLEDFWGNVFQWIDGLYCDAQRNILTATDKFNDTGSGYTNQGKGANANIAGYISDVQGSTKTGFIAKTCSGSQTTHYADYGSLFASYLPIFGSSWDYGSGAGAFCLRVDGSASVSSSDVGARLMYL